MRWLVFRDQQVHGVSSLDPEDDQVIGRCGTSKPDNQLELVCLQQAWLRDGKVEFLRQVIVSDKGLRPVRELTSALCVYGTANGFWLSSVGISCEKLPNVMSEAISVRVLQACQDR